MMQQVFAMVVIPCISALSQPPGTTETIVYVCPETVHFMVVRDTELLTPRKYAVNSHLTNGHRDDRMPPEVKKAEPVKATAPKKKKPKKSKRKKRRS